MKGSTSRPGMTHNEATEKPVARTRAGMASDSDTRMLGPTMASAAVMTQLMATATTMLGANANSTDSIEVNAAIFAPNWLTPRMLPAYRRVTTRVPTMSPTSAKGSAIAAAKPRPRSSRPNSCSYNSAARVVNPMSDVARNGRLHHSRFRLSTLCTVRQLSANDGLVSSVATTSSLMPIACRSQRPRTGSRRRRASTTNTNVGATNTMNGTRQSNA